LKREVIITSDGSSTIHLPDWDEQYHSKHGAIQEAYHVFIKYGLHHYFDTTCISESSKNNLELSILEIGFGTGLNAFITLLESEKLNQKITYNGVEGYPISQEEINQLNYAEQLNTPKSTSLFNEIHNAKWGEKNQITKLFALTKHEKFFNDIDDIEKYHIIYFDAFGARVQPELWTETIFEKMYNALKPKGVLVTYSAKGSVRRAMIAVGFSVEKLPGPPGKREMLRATK
jgi:tRNA U34 5-methylaminomethyl-2-thiouridine-forming methyltransferase MnmC